MRDPAGLYDLFIDVSDVPTGLHLVAGLTGFTDAGSAVTQLSDYLLDTLDTQLVASFDNDDPAIASGFRPRWAYASSSMRSTLTN